MLITEEDYLLHYGTPRHSGRYPWGSGDNETSTTRNMSTMDAINDLRKQGVSEKDIAEGFGMTIAELRAERSIARNAKRAADINMAHRLQEKGYSTNKIAKRMEIPESTARNLLRPGELEKATIIENTANAIKAEVDQYGFTDIGKGVENYLGVTSTRLNTAVQMLRNQGYEVHNFNAPQVATGEDTKTKVIGPPGSTQKEAWMNQDKIHTLSTYSEDGGKQWTEKLPPLAINPKRVGVRYAGEGGEEADGVIFVRPGVKDIELGGSQYAQVRIQVGEGHYLKGMAVYKDDLPPGVDLQFNTSKERTKNKLDAMKPLKDDPDLPFGSIVRQIQSDPGTPKAKVTSVMNIVNDEGDWAKWSRTLSSQMLSKQSPVLAKQQLDMTYERRENDYNNINALTNPTVRKKLLLDFAGATDSAAVHLKAAALPGQAVKVLLPLSTIKPNQIYAPGFQNGERVALIRHPHGGTFEIPDLIVNNKNVEGHRLLGKDASVAVGIHHDVAKHLSGADFDGDTVLVIPNRSNRIIITPALKELQNFNPHTSYPGYEGMKPMRNTETEMGSISNLITDMTIRQASHEELARAIRHSMVVIDAEKHNLDHKASYNDNNIKDLKVKYQRPNGEKSSGASTLISRAKSELRVPQRKARLQEHGGPINKETGELEWEPTGRKNWRTGTPLTTKTTKLAEARDARALSSGTPVEELYATHSNKLKTLANRARLDAINTPNAKYSAPARKIYEHEVTSLNSKLSLAKSNAPLERSAQRIANAQIKLKKQFDPNMDQETYNKVKYQQLEEARRRTGADKHKIEITPAEWDAIQAGAISNSMLEEVLTHADMKVVRELAMPKHKILMSSPMQARAKSMYALGYTRAEVAQQLGVSVSTLDASVSVGEKG